MDGVVQEDFEYICVAHNGKCAERLMREAGTFFLCMNLQPLKK